MPHVLRQQLRVPHRVVSVEMHERLKTDGALKLGALLGRQVLGVVRNDVAEHVGGHVGRVAEAYSTYEVGMIG